MTTNHDALREAFQNEFDKLGYLWSESNQEKAFLGWKLALAASKPEQQAQAEPGEDDGFWGRVAARATIKVARLEEALAAKDAALDVALEALEESLKKGFESNWPAQGRVAAAIAKIKEARK